MGDPTAVTVASPLPLLLVLMLTESCWASTPSQRPDAASVPVSSSSSVSAWPRESLSTSKSHSVLPSSPALEATPSGLTPSSPRGLATHTSALAASVPEATTAATAPSPSDAPVKEEEAASTERENATLPFRETASSKVISASTAAFPRTSKAGPASQTASTSAASLTNVSPANRLKQAGSSSLLVILLVALLVSALLGALCLLWRQRHKRRTGALSLVGGSGKRNGAADAWAGPVQVPEEPAASGSAALEGDPGRLEGEGTGRRPTLTTFFGRRKSRQASVMLEALEAGTATHPSEESEPLVDSTGGTGEPPAARASSADGSGAGDGNSPSAPVTKV